MRSYSDISTIHPLNAPKWVCPPARVGDAMKALAAVVAVSALLASIIPLTSSAAWAQQPPESVVGDEEPAPVAGAPNPVDSGDTPVEPAPALPEGGAVDVPNPEIVAPVAPPQPEPPATEQAEAPLQPEALASPPAPIAEPVPEPDAPPPSHAAPVEQPMVADAVSSETVDMPSRPRSPPARARDAQQPRDPSAFTVCTEDPAQNACQQLVGICRLDPGAAGCAAMRERCGPLRNDPSARLVAPECGAYQDVELCFEQPLSRSCDPYLERPCARDGGVEPDNSPACRIRERVAEKRREERRRQREGEGGGGTVDGDTDVGGTVPSAGPVSGPVATAALLVALGRTLDGQVAPRAGPVSLALARASLSGRRVHLTLHCPTEGARGRLSLHLRRGMSALSSESFRCTAPGSMPIIVTLSTQQAERIRDTRQSRVWIQIKELSPLGRRQTSWTAVVVITA
jgi:hypothetical protein